MFNGPANLKKFHRKKRDRSCSKDPYFLCLKTLHIKRNSHDSETSDFIARFYRFMFKEVSFNAKHYVME